MARKQWVAWVDWKGVVWKHLTAWMAGMISRDWMAWKHWVVWVDWKGVEPWRPSMFRWIYSLTSIHSEDGSLHSLIQSMILIHWIALIHSMHELDHHSICWVRSPNFSLPLIHSMSSSASIPSTIAPFPHHYSPSLLALQQNILLTQVLRGAATQSIAFPPSSLSSSSSSSTFLSSQLPQPPFRSSFLSPHPSLPQRKLLSSIHPFAAAVKPSADLRIAWLSVARRATAERERTARRGIYIAHSQRFYRHITVMNWISTLFDSCTNMINAVSANDFRAGFARVIIWKA